MTTLHDILATWEAERSADRDATRTSPSDLGALCVRQVAFRLNGRSPTDEVEPVTVATVGSLIHAGVALLWDEDPDILGTEVHFPDGGSADALHGPDVRDLKTLGRAKYDAWALHDGPPEGVWLQLAAYGARALRTGGATVVNGAVEQVPPVDWVRDLVVDALCRETGRCATYRRPYTQDLGTQAEAALVNLEQETRGWDPLDIPTTRTGRGDWLCDACPWLTACQGPDARPQMPALDSQAAADALEQYARARDLEKEAVAAKEAARALLAATPAGRYGDWRLAWTRPREAVDWKEVRRLLVDVYGADLPVKVDSDGMPLLGDPIIRVERVR